MREDPKAFPIQQPTEEVDVDGGDLGSVQASAGGSEVENPVLTAGLFVPEDPEEFGETKKFLDNIADAFQALSVEDKDRVTRRVYGIEEHEEAKSPQFKEAKLVEMERELQDLQAGNAWSMRLGAIQMAEAQNYDYIHNQAFRLKFLRTEQWDATQAAARFIRHFDYKLDLFGADCLGRDITFADLTKEDVKALKKGYYQILPVRDRAGRAIFVGFYAGQKYQSLASVCRVNFYTTSHVDEETEDLGVVSVTYQLQDVSFKETPSSYVEVCTKLWRLGSDMPFRYDAWHTLLEEGARDEHDRVDRDLSLLDEKIMAASRAHYGNFNFWMNELMAFGLPIDQIPFTPSHKVKNKNHLDYLEMRKKIEEELATAKKDENGITCLAESKAILVPTRKDVLFGKGKPTQFAIGNQRLALLIDGYLDQYHNKSSKVEKTALAAEIVRIAKSSGVRFLAKTSGVWREVDDNLARDKVSHMFRHQGTNIKEEPQTQQQQQQTVNYDMGKESMIGTVRPTPEPSLKTSIYQLEALLDANAASILSLTANKRFKF